LEQHERFFSARLDTNSGHVEFAPLPSIAQEETSNFDVLTNGQCAIQPFRYLPTGTKAVAQKAFAKSYCLQGSYTLYDKMAFILLPFRTNQILKTNFHSTGIKVVMEPGSTGH
jgi:hypothetical protein